MSLNDEKALSEEVDNTKPKDITLSFMKNYLRVDFDDDDNDKMIKSMLTAAKSFTKTYLRYDEKEFDDAANEITIAVLSITEHWYKNRGILNEDTTRKELPFVFSGILDIHRNWEVG